MIYGIDGDKMGRAIESFFIKNDLISLSNFSTEIAKGLEDIKTLVIENQGRII